MPYAVKSALRMRVGAEREYVKGMGNQETSSMPPRVRLNRPADPLECLRLHEVARLLHVSRFTIRGWVRRGKFPKPIPASEAVRLWRRSTVEAWLQEREGRS